MATNYEKGRAFEYKARNYWRRKGWSCDRTPASKTPYDLTAVKRAGKGLSSVLRIQCQAGKKSASFSYKKVRDLILWCYKENSHPLLQWEQGGKTKIKHAVDYLVEGK